MPGPSTATIKRLFATSGNRCAFPGCDTNLVLDNEQLVGEVCHICAARPGGKRYDPNQTEDERHSYQNLIILCSTHHTIIDSDEVTYSAEMLRRMKKDHTGTTDGRFQISETLVSKIVLALAGVGVERVGTAAIRSVHDLIAVFSPNTKRPAPKPIKLVDQASAALRYAPKGAVHWHSFTDEAVSLIAALLETFRRAGWRVTQMQDASNGLGADPKDRISEALFMFEASSQHQLPVMKQAVKEALGIWGFRGEADGQRSRRNDDGSVVRLSVTFHVRR